MTTLKNNLKEVKLGETMTSFFATMPEVIVQGRAPVPVGVYNLEGKFLYACESVEQAAEKTKISSVSIKRAINPKHEKTHVRKFQFAPVQNQN